MSGYSDLLPLLLGGLKPPVSIPQTARPAPDADAGRRPVPEFAALLSLLLSDGENNGATSSLVSAMLLRAAVAAGAPLPVHPATVSALPPAIVPGRNGGASSRTALPNTTGTTRTGTSSASPAAGPGYWEELFQEAAARYDLDPALLKAVARAESSFDPQAVSPAGAAGLMQLMPATARALGVTDVFDPRQNILAGARYLRQLLDRFAGDLPLALAAYNAGPGAVERHGGIPPYRETRQYVSRVLKFCQLYA
ncbi:MAG: lytic transglycosylase domain-containing protein [Desulfurispora sp.]|uniref:lytic transglycosylase domain-containing protein n=1 Tax=Desulfurispora sp. TaxID=3014275 RepID=UPI00404A121C